MGYLSPRESSDWKETNLNTPTHSRHPVLYGVAIYALCLIIIGTIGKFIYQILK